MKNSSAVPVRAVEEWRSTLAKILRARREAAGLSWVKLEGRSGLGKGRVYEIETCRRGPSIDTLVRLSRGLNVNLDELLGLPDRADPDASPPSAIHRGWRKQMGPRLEYARLRKQFKQAGLARVTGISAGLLSNAERGTRFLSVENLIVLCLRLEVPLRWMLDQPNFPEGK